MLFRGIGGEEKNVGGGLTVVCVCGRDDALCWGMGCPCPCWYCLGANCFVAGGASEGHLNILSIVDVPLLDLYTWTRFCVILIRQWWPGSRGI